jgi:hypothetical protein
MAATRPSPHVAATLEAEIAANRVHKTATCQVVEREICAVLAASTLPPAIISALFEKLVTLFAAVQEMRNAWLPDAINIGEMRDLYKTGNQRQLFHALRAFLGPLQMILSQLATSHKAGEAYLSRLGEQGVVNPSKVLFFVANAAFGDISEILSPPEDLRRIWKPVARERQAPEDCGESGSFTANMWQTDACVKDATMPPVSEAEVKAVFGDDATLASHADRRLPYYCGANKYRLVESDPIVIAATACGFPMTSGPSGTAGWP